MPQYIITNCTVADAADVARNNMSAFWQDPNWRLVWREQPAGLPYVIKQCTDRSPRNLLKDRADHRHLKAVDPETGRFVGYIRFVLPPRLVGTGTGGPVWPEAQTPDVAAEEREEIERVASAADWTHAEDDLDPPLTRKKAELMAKKEYILLDFLAVHPENQGKGIATALVQAGIKKAEELGVDILVLAFVGGFKVYNNTGFKSLWTYVQDATRFGGTKDYTVQLMEYEVEKK